MKCTFCVGKPHTQTPLLIVLVSASVEASHWPPIGRSGDGSLQSSIQAVIGWLGQAAILNDSGINTRGAEKKYLSHPLSHTHTSKHLPFVAFNAPAKPPKVLRHDTTGGCYRLCVCVCVCVRVIEKIPHTDSACTHLQPQCSYQYYDACAMHPWLKNSQFVSEPPGIREIGISKLNHPHSPPLSLATPFYHSCNERVHAIIPRRWNHSFSMRWGKESITRLRISECYLCLLDQFLQTEFKDKILIILELLKPNSTKTLMLKSPKSVASKWIWCSGRIRCWKPIL